MKKILILAYDFPPYVSVGGLRPYNWFKYFKQYDVEPIVVTRQWENKYGSELDYIAPSASKEVVIEENEFGTIIRAPYFPNLANKIILKYGEKRFRLLRKMISLYYEVFQFVLPIGPKLTIYKAAKNYLKANKVDAIIATGDPFVLFYYAKKMSEIYQIPWMADYRDPWSDDISLTKKPLLRYWFRRQELKIIETTYAVLTVVPFLVQKIEKINPNKTIHVFPNGFDDELAEKVKHVEQSKDELVITYAGSVYDWHPLLRFCSALEEVLKSTSSVKLKLQFIGISKMEDYRAKIKENCPVLFHHIAFIPRVANQELFSYLAKSNVLLLFNDYSIIGTKIFDYLAVKRHVLLCFSNDPEAMKLKKHFKSDESHSPDKQAQATLLQKTNAGEMIKDAADLKIALAKLMEEFKKNKSITCATTDVAQYARRAQVKKMAELINNM